MCVQVSREQEQQVELGKLKKELELRRSEAINAQSALQSKEAVGISVHHTLDMTLMQSDCYHLF